MRLAVQEDMLAGGSAAEKFAFARSTGADGVEVWAHDLPQRMEAIAAAMTETGLAVAAVHYGRQPSILDPDPVAREAALALVRDAITCASDLGAAAMVYAPFGDHVLPDLSPFMTAAELEVELLYTHLRTLEDFAMAMGVTFLLHVAPRSDSRLLYRLEQGGTILKRLNHPNVRLAAEMAQMDVGEGGSAYAVRAYAHAIGHLYLADEQRRLPGQGQIDFGALGSALHEIGYRGWAVLSGGAPGTHESSTASERDLTAAVTYLQERGF
jgi:sugar phosphate isomerase/epimerase